MKQISTTSDRSRITLYRFLAVGLFVNEFTMLWNMLLVGFDSWLAALVVRYVILDYPMTALYGIPVYAVQVPAWLAFLAALVWLWRTGRKRALAGAIVMAIFCFLVLAASVLSTFSMPGDGRDPCLEEGGCRGG